MEYDPDSDSDDRSRQQRPVAETEDDLIDAATAFIEEDTELYGGGAYGPNTTFTREPTDLDPGYGQAMTALEDQDVVADGFGVAYDLFRDETDEDEDRLVGLFASAAYQHDPGDHTWDLETDRSAAYVGARLPEDTSLRIEADVLGAGDQASGYIINTARTGGLGQGHDGVVVDAGRTGVLAARATGITVNLPSADHDRPSGRVGVQQSGVLVNHGPARSLGSEASGIVINYAEDIELPSDASIVINHAEDVDSTQAERGPDGALFDTANERSDQRRWSTVWDRDDLEHHPALRGYLRELGQALAPGRETAAVVGELQAYAPRPQDRIRNELSVLTRGDIDAV